MQLNLFTKMKETDENQHIASFFSWKQFQS